MAADCIVAGLLFKFTKNLSALVILNSLNCFLTYAVLFRYI
jgi:hypothetical protein